MMGMRWKIESILGEMYGLRMMGLQWKIEMGFQP
jgi:hypothetical protein